MKEIVAFNYFKRYITTSHAYLLNYLRELFTKKSVNYIDLGSKLKILRMKPETLILLLHDNLDTDVEIKVKY